MDVRRAPGVAVVSPRVGTRRNRDEPVPSPRVGDTSPDPVEVRVERRRVVLARVAVSPGRIGLPDLDQRVRHRPPVGVEYPPGHDDPLSLRLAVVLPGQVGISGGDQVVAEQRPGHLGEQVRQQDQRALGVPQRGRAVPGEVQRRVHAGGALVHRPGRARRCRSRRSSKPRRSYALSRAGCAARLAQNDTAAAIAIRTDVPRRTCSPAGHAHAPGGSSAASASARAATLKA